MLNRMLTAGGLAAVLTTVMVVCETGAQDTAVSDEPATPLLAGPSVTGESGPVDLGVMNLDGSMQRLEVTPAEAAVELLDLDEPTRARVEALLAARAGAVDEFVQRNRDIVMLLPTLRDPANRDARREVMERVRTGLADVIAAGPLETQITPLLPEDQREQYATILRNHRAQALEARLRAMEPGQADRIRARLERRGGETERGRWGSAVQEILTVELRRGYQRVLEQRQSGVESLIERLQLSPESEEKVRRILREAASEAGDAREIDRRAVLREIRGVLTPEEQQQLRQTMRARGADR